MTTARLGAATIGGLTAGVPGPVYDRSQLAVGIVHIGVGAFARSHQAMYLDRLMGAGRALDWGICGIDLLAADEPKAATFAAQDGLYTLIVKHGDGSFEPTVIGSLAEYLFAPAAPRRVLARLTSPATRIVTLTITEGGYNVHPVTGEFDRANAAILADLRPDASPSTVFGYLTEALRRRRAAGIPPFTIASCDNLPGNGDLAGRMFAAYADLAQPGLGDWVREHVAFPNSMVDRITPVTTETDSARLLAEFGIHDAWPVVCEPFTQWVLEDNFPLGRPPWEDCGVQLVADVTPYELMKLRLVNGGHQALGYAGSLAGYRYAHEAAADPVLAEFVAGYLQAEARPTLPPVPDVDLDTYIATLLRRFENPAMADTLARLCAASSDRMPTFVLPVLRANLAAGRDVRRAATIVASWARYATGQDDSGRPIELVDPMRDELIARAARQKDEPLSFVRHERLFGDLASAAGFTSPYRQALASFARVGARETLRRVNADLAS